MLIIPFGRRICVKVLKVERNSNSRWISREDHSKNRLWRQDAILNLPAALQNTGLWCAENSYNMRHIVEMGTLVLLYINLDPKCVGWSVRSKKHEEYLHTCWHDLVKSMKYLVLSYSLEDLPKKLLVLLIKVVSQSEMKYRLCYSGIWTALLSKVKALHDQLSCWCLICPDFVSSGLLAIVHKHSKNLSFRFEILL